MQDPKLDILLIEDNAAEAALIKASLEEAANRQFCVRHVVYLAEGLSLLKKESFDCVLVDLGLPDSQGLKTALSVREVSQQVPVVVLTVLNDIEAALTSLQMDIQDYLVKSEINGAILVRSILYAIERKRLTTELWESEQRFTSFMSNLPAAAWIKELDGRYCYVNAEAARIFGKTPQEVLGKRDEDIFPSETAQQFRENDQRVVTEGDFLTTELLRQEDGIEHTSLVRKFSIPGVAESACIAGVAFDITEQRQAQEVIRESKQKLEELTKLLEYAPVLIRNTEDEILVWNLGMVALYGFTREEAEGKVSHQLLRTAFPQPLVEIESTLRSTGRWQGELRHIRSNGRGITVASLWVLHETAPGNSVIIEVNNDVTSLKEAEEKFSKIFQATPTLVVLSTLQKGVILDANKAALETLGYRRDEFIGRSLEELDVWEDRTLRARIVQELENERPVRDFEIAFRCRAGEVIIGLLSADLIEVKGERCILTLVKDLTERKHAEEALVRAKEEWERTFDSVPDLIAILDSEHRVLRVNRVMAERVGRDPEECIGLPCHQIVHGTGLPVQLCPHGHTRGDAKEHRAEIYEQRLGVHFLVTTTPLTDPDGKMVGVVHVARDITESKRTEEEIRLLNAELAERASQLEAANKELETFNYTAAHDLRQPLNLISGYTQTVEMLYGDKLDEDCLGYLQGTRGAVDRMNQLIEALLKYSRLGRIELEKKQVDLSEMAHSLAEELRKSEPEREVSFKIQEGIKVNGDGALLRMVLENLIGNAWKYTKMTEERIALIEFGAVEVNGEKAYFIKDNGPGFDVTDAAKLFAPFQRLPGAEAFRGFGIGLATVDRIVLRHGGRVWAEGEPGRGATFYFTLSADGPAERM